MPRLLTAISASLALTTSALAQQGFEWSLYSDLAADPMASQIALSYGLAQSDATQFLAMCEVTTGGSYASVRLAAETGGRGNGMPVEVQFTDGLGSQLSLIATISGVGDDLGVTGILMPLPLEHPFFTMLQEGGTLFYAIEHGQAAALSLVGAQGPLTLFLNDCFSPTATAQTRGCDRLDSLASQNGNTAQRMIFTNRTDEYRALYWIDYQGAFHEYGVLQGGETLVVDSYLTHPWMVLDGPGECTEVIEPQAGVLHYDIIAPSRYFGLE